MAKQPAADPKPETLTFEAALNRLEQLCSQLDTQDVPLEELIGSYQEGLKLVRICEERIKDAEKRIEILARDVAGEPVITEFEPDAKTPSKPRDDVSLF